MNAHKRKRRGIEAKTILPRSLTGNLLPPILIILAGVLAYFNSLTVPFLFDDFGAILDNPTIRHLGSSFFPPAETTVTGRPLLNFSFALNFGMAKFNVGSYHAVNIAIHIACGLLLLGILRRTFRTERFASYNASGDVIATICALLWVVHPLQTESVTYIVQRAESLGSFWYLLTLYLFIRGTSSERRSGWYAGSVAACAAGLLTKEIVATAPLLVLLYDRCIYSGSLRLALKSRSRYFLLLFATLIIAVIAALQGRPGSAGFHEGMSGLQYAKAQFGVVLHYLYLCLFPHPLVFDYGWVVPAGIWGVAAPAVIIVGLLGISIALLIRNHPAGLAAFGFFLVLAPTSTFIPIVTEVAAEHRAYLPSAGIIILVVTGVFSLLNRYFKRAAARALCAVGGILVVICGIATAARNRDYRDPVTLWSDTILKRPMNARAQYNLARSMEETGDPSSAIEVYKRAIRLKPNYVEARNNLAMAYLHIGQMQEAISQLRAAIRAVPEFALSHNNLGLVLAQAGDLPGAIAEYKRSIELDPGYAEACYNAANALAQQNELEEALRYYEKSASLKPGFAPPLINAAITSSRLGRQDEAMSLYTRAISADPDSAKAHFNYGLLLAEKGSREEARDQLMRAGELGMQREAAEALAHLQ
jgi:tetratricopeptide (TPR) repeat protein